MGDDRVMVASKSGLGVIRGAGFLLISQILCRLISFFLNLIAARHLGPEGYGVGAVQFHLLTSTILFLSR